MIQGVHTKYFTHFIFNIANYHLLLKGVCGSYRAQTDIALSEFYLHYSHVVFVCHNLSTCTQVLFELLEFQHTSESVITMSFAPHGLKASLGVDQFLINTFSAGLIGHHHHL